MPIRPVCYHLHLKILSQLLHQINALWTHLIPVSSETQNLFALKCR